MYKMVTGWLIMGMNHGLWGVRCRRQRIDDSLSILFIVLYSYQILVLHETILQSPY